MGILNSLSETAQLGWSLTQEAGATVLTCELYPLGVFPRMLPVVSKPWGESSSLPILFIHGAFQNRAAFAWLKNRLAWAGCKQFVDINLFTGIRPVEENAKLIGRKVDEMRKKFKVDQVNIVGHSMGGILGRYYVQFLGGDSAVNHLVTLGTPHQGTKITRIPLLPQLAELRPGSKTLTKLNASPCPNNVTGVAISGDLDFFMVPRTCTRWEGARNISLKGVGHAGLLFSRRVAQIITSHFCRSAEETKVA